MKRREFLRLAGVAGMAAVLPGWTRPGMAAAYNGPILITLHAWWLVGTRVPSVILREDSAGESLGWQRAGRARR